MAADSIIARSTSDRQEDDPQFSELGPIEKPFTHAGREYVLVTITSRCHALEGIDGECYGTFVSPLAARRFLETVEYH